VTALALPQVRSRPRAARAAAILLVAIAGLAIRIWIDRSAVGVPDSDEAVVGLMVRHALHGHLDTFYWGQGYGGTQEILLTVPLFAVFGASYTALRAVPIALNALAAVLVWRVGRRTVGEPAATLAAVLMWLWFPDNLVLVTRQLGFYGSNLVYGSLLLLLVLRVVERPTTLRAALLGLTLGLAFWQTLQIVPLAVPALGWLVWKEPRALRQAWAAAAGAVVGALPWLIWNIRHDWGSLLPRADAHQYAHSLRLFASPLLPMTLGLRTPVTGALVVPSKLLVTGVYLALLALCGYGVVTSRRRSTALLYAVVLLFPFVWAISRRVTFLSATPRFLIVLTPVIALLVAQLGRSVAKAVVVVALAVAVSIVSVHRMDVDARTVDPDGVEKAPRDLHGLISTLDRARIDYVYADYWIAYRLAFDSHERIVGSELGPQGVSLRNGVVVRPAGVAPRYPPYARRVAANRHAFVYFRRSSSLPFPTELVAAGYHRVVTGPFAVYLPAGT